MSGDVASPEPGTSSDGPSESTGVRSLVGLPPLPAASDGAEPSPPGPPAEPPAADFPPRTYFPGARVFPIVSAVVFGISALLWWPVLATPTVQVSDSALVIGGLILIGAFLFGELFPLQIEVRRETWLVSGSELPMVIGLLVLPPWLVGATHAAAGLLVFLFRRDNWRNVAVNLSFIVVETGTAAAVMLAITRPDSSISLRYLGVGAGVLAGALMSALAVSLTYRLIGPSEPMVRFMARATLAGGTVVTFALVGFTVWQSGSAGWVLCLLMAAVLVAIYRTYFVFLRQHSDLAQMYAIGRQITGIGSSQGEWQEVLAQIRDQMNAEVAVLHLRDEEGAHRTLAAGPDGPLEVADVDCEDPLILAARRSGAARASADRTEDAEVLQALAQRPAWDVMVVPLQTDERDRGYLEVRDRVTRWGRFREDDEKVLETLSGQIVTALENLRLLETLRHEAYHDAITGLLNRPGLTVQVQNAIAQQRGGAVLMVELNVLSQVNNALGHDRGERLLRAAGDRLRELTGPDRAVARIETDRFAVLLEAMPEVEMVTFGAQMLRVASAAYGLDGIEVDPQPSLGIAIITATATADVLGDMAIEPGTMLQRAEMAMLAARSRQDSLQIYRPSMGEVYRRRFQLVTQFRQAIEQGRIVVHYQPKINLADRELIGVEALVRWMHPEFGLVSPAEFVEAIEATGYIDILLDHVLGIVLQQLAEWTGQGIRICAAVNLSVRNLMAVGFPGRVSDALRRHGVDPSLLTFEITESSVMDDPEHSLPVLNRLHALGVGLSVDDFGTGYSSLAYLRRLPIDEIKIDRSFVLGMGSDLGDLAIVRAIVDLGHSLGLRVVAEGVEEEAARDALRDMHCDQAQGYLISRPLPLDRFEAWLASRTVTIYDPASSVHVLRMMS